MLAFASVAGARGWPQRFLPALEAERPLSIFPGQAGVAG
jgi:hypothetical protein